MHPNNKELAGIECKIRRVRTGVRHDLGAQVLGIPPSTLGAWEHERIPVPSGRAGQVEQAIRRRVTGNAQGGGDARTR